MTKYTVTTGILTTFRAEKIILFHVFFRLTLE